jgi:hypothetical protein
VFALALAAYAAYSLRGRLTRKGDGADGGHPPPWPVSPSNVATAAQLIQAFEHLALRTLGVVARPWHHARIAERLAAAAGDACHAQAVRRLSAAYEQARYAPAPLAEADLAAARADLCLVAGVSAA